MSATDTVPRAVEPQSGSVIRRLAVAWQHPDNRLISPVAMLEFDGTDYLFYYIANAESVEGFQPLLGFADLHRVYSSPHLFPIFAQRVMDPRRPDHARYVQRLGLSDDASPWEQMTRSGGRREGDLLQMFPEPEVREDGSVVCSFLVHGIRHIPDSGVDGRGHTVTSETLARKLDSLGRGQALRLTREPRNPVNDRAVLTTTQDNFPLGWVPDFLLDDLYAMSNGHPEKVEVTVQQINGPDAPPHLRLLARLVGQPTDAYQPFAGPSWSRLGQD